MKQHYRAASLRSRRELELASWGRRKRAIIGQEKPPTSMEAAVRYDRWQRIRVPASEPRVPEPGSAQSRLLDVTSNIGMTGVIKVSDMAELAEDFALIPEDADWSRLLRVISRAHTIR
jgi:hypothetical protein